MQIIEPISITDASIHGTNVPETDAPVYSASDTYGVDSEVIVKADHAVYISVVAGNSGNDPSTDEGTNWVRKGATNRWKAFDTFISDPVIQDDDIRYTIEVDSFVSGLAMFGLEADRALVTVSLGDQSVTIEKDLVNREDIDTYNTWFFSGVDRASEALFLDLPYFGVGTRYWIRLFGDGPVKCGQIVLGRVTTLGTTPWGATLGIYDASRKERDDYGNAIIVERAFAQTARIPVQIEAVRSKAVLNKLASYRATPVVWIGDDRPDYGLIIYGFYTTYSHVLTSGEMSNYSLTIEGLT